MQRLLLALRSEERHRLLEQVQGGPVRDTDPFPDPEIPRITPAGLNGLYSTLRDWDSDFQVHRPTVATVMQGKT